MSDALPYSENIFEDLVPEAKSVLRRLMHNSRDEKIIRGTAVDILDRAGVKAKEAAQSAPILIKDSQVQLLVQVAAEIKRFRGSKDEDTG
jgi:hypothetical protein